MQSVRYDIAKALIGNWPDSEKVLGILKGKKRIKLDRLE